RTIRGRPVLWYLCGAAFFVALSSEGRDRLGQPHLLLDYRFPPVGTPALWFGAFGIVAGLGSVVLTQLVRGRATTLAPARLGRLVTAFEAGSALAVLVFALAGSFWLAAVASLAAALLQA